MDAVIEISIMPMECIFFFELMECIKDMQAITYDNEFLNTTFNQLE